MIGALGISFPKDSLLKASASGPSMLSVMRECLFNRGVNLHLLYYLLPALAFVSLYSILPHKVRTWIYREYYDDYAQNDIYCLI